MKVKFTIYDLRFTIEKQSERPAAANRQSSIVNHQSRSGVALILTLILLSVTLLMTLAFLALSNRERNAASTSTDAAVSRLAADAALSAAEAQIAANIFSTTNPYSFGLLVSTNHDTDDSFGNLANLFISPRVPVWLLNLTRVTMEDRFYLDLNRNGHDDPNGWVPNVDNNGNVISNAPAALEVGDPEWIGLLEHPDQPYGPNNPFVAEFAFFAVPVGNSLDLNAIFNETLNTNFSSNDGYFRNQGAGSWELNLPAFLCGFEYESVGLFYQYVLSNRDKRFFQPWHNLRRRPGVAGFPLRE